MYLIFRTDLRGGKDLVEEYMLRVGENELKKQKHGNAKFPCVTNICLG